MQALGDLRLEAPWALALLAPLVALLAWQAWRERLATRGVVMRFPDGESFVALPRTWAVRLNALPDVLRLAAVVALAIGLARPQLVGAPTAAEERGIDIVLALDTSTSMAAADFQPKDRMFVAKRSVDTFVRSRKSDRIGLVVFAGEAATWAPLTLDYELVSTLLDEVELGMLPDGTAIGTAIGTALNRLKKSDAESKVVVLLTDGDNNAGEISPRAAAELARDMGVKIYTILIGTDGPVPVPRGNDLFGRPVFVRQVMPINPKLLEELASMTGGEAFRATDKAELDARLVAVLDRLDRSKLQAPRELRPYLELFPWCVGVGLALLALELVLSSTRLWRFP